MAVCTALNFLEVMAEQALADDTHRAFAEQKLETLCSVGLRDLLASIRQLAALEL